MSSDRQVNIHLNVFPPELIADEYIRHYRDNAILYIFYDNNYEPYVERYKKIFENDRCRCAQMFLITKHDQVLTDINTILNQQNHDNKDCFMLLFLGTLTKEEVPDLYITQDADKPIKGIDIWRPIANSDRIIYRPKIFIFNAFILSSSVKTDSPKMFIAPYHEPEAIYTIPREADVLVVYKKTSHSDCQPSQYFQNLYKNLNQFGDRDDFVNILTYTETSNETDAHPLIVSTLRKKFYVRDGRYRGHWADINKHMANYSDELKLILDNFNQHLQNKRSRSEATSALDSGTGADAVATAKSVRNRKKSRHMPNDSINHTTIFYGLFWLILICGVMIGLSSSFIK